METDNGHMLLSTQPEIPIGIYQSMMLRWKQ